MEKDNEENTVKREGGNPNPDGNYLRVSGGVVYQYVKNGEVRYDWVERDEDKQPAPPQSGTTAKALGHGAIAGA